MDPIRTPSVKRKNEDSNERGDPINIKISNVYSIAQNETVDTKTDGFDKEGPRKMHTIKLRSQDGTDMGHVNLFMKADQAKSLNGKIIKLAKLSHELKDNSIEISNDSLVSYQITPITGKGETVSKETPKIIPVKNLAKPVTIITNGITQSQKLANSVLKKSVNLPVTEVQKVRKIYPAKKVKIVMCNQQDQKAVPKFRHIRPAPPKNATIIYPVKVKMIRNEIPQKPIEEIKLKEEHTMNQETIEQDPLADDRIPTDLPNENIQKITITLANPVKGLADENPVLASFLQASTASNQIKLTNSRETNLSLIEKAMDSISDKTLRDKALKALEDCGVHLEKRLPITQETKVVTDRSIQTEVFSLLEKGTFILADNKSEDLQRLPQRIDLIPDPNTQDIETGSNFEDHSMFPKNPNETIDIDSFFDNLSNKNSEVCKVKDALSTPNKNVTERLAVQLQRDYDSIKLYGEDGMLGIHRAVVNNNLSEVQRLLMVLKACQDDANVETANGMTCLELAVSSCASSEIVLALLKAGATPISARLVHDSAVILASKQSSSHLKDLISYVKQPFLLNLTGPEGFNALHYCAMLGNLEGVRLLLDAGVNMNMRDSRSGRTAIFHAVESNHVKISALLHERNATLTIPNFSGQTVVSLLHETTNSRLKKTFAELFTPGEHS